MPDHSDEKKVTYVPFEMNMVSNRTHVSNNNNSYDENENENGNRQRETTVNNWWCCYYTRRNLEEREGESFVVAAEDSLFYLIEL